MNDFYDYTDREIRYLNKQINRVFQKTMNTDELNVIRTSKKMYEQLEETAKEAYLRIARKKWPKATKKWLIAFLDGYDPVTGYVFFHELERKRARFAEGTVAGTEDGTAKRLLAAMLAQYAIEITDEAMKAQWQQEGIEKVRWVSKESPKRCKVCQERHGKVYPIRDVPPKPHLHCRCTLEPVK